MNTKQDTERQVIPRWRLSVDTKRVGEFKPERELVRDEPLAAGSLRLRKQDWARRQSVGSDADLLNTASVAERCDFDIRAAAERVLASKDTPGPLQRLARLCLGYENGNEDGGQSLTGRVEEDRRSLRQLLAAAKASV